MSPGSLSFAKMVMMSSAPAKSAGDARYASQDPFIYSLIVHTILTQDAIGVCSTSNAITMTIYNAPKSKTSRAL